MKTKDLKYIHSNNELNKIKNVKSPQGKDFLL